MNALVRSSTTTLSRRSSADGYEPLDRRPRLGEASKQHVRSSRGSSKRKKLDHTIMYPFKTNGNSRSYRAKQRRIFLKSYELASAEKLQSRRRAAPRRLCKSLAVKAVNAVVSAVTFLRAASGWSRNCRLSVKASCPSPVNKNPIGF